MAEYRRLAKAGARSSSRAATTRSSTGTDARSGSSSSPPDVTAAVLERRRRAALQDTIAHDLNAIADGRLRRLAAGRAGGPGIGPCLGDIQTVASGRRGARRLGRGDQRAGHAGIGDLRAGGGPGPGDAPDHRGPQRLGGPDRRGRPLIQSIAAQTNLLALNATIEAARAGEGRSRFRGGRRGGEGTGQPDRPGHGADWHADHREPGRDPGGRRGDRSIQGTIVRLNEVATAISSAVEQQSAVTREMSASMQTAAQGVGAITTNLERIAQSASRRTAPRSSCAPPRGMPPRALASEPRSADCSRSGHGVGRQGRRHSRPSIIRSESTASSAADGAGPAACRVRRAARTSSMLVRRAALSGADSASSAMVRTRPWPKRGRPPSPRLEAPLTGPYPDRSATGRGPEGRAQSPAPSRKQPYRLRGRRGESSGCTNAAACPSGSPGHRSAAGIPRIRAASREKPQMRAIVAPEARLRGAQGRPFDGTRVCASASERISGSCGMARPAEGFFSSSRGRREVLGRDARAHPHNRSNRSPNLLISISV